MDLRSPQKIWQKISWPTATVLLSLFVAYLIFGVYFTAPNDHMMAFGGDPLVIYFDMLYHVRFGEGTLFTGMNYPHGEYIFLTDMQGSFTLLLQWLHQFFPTLDGYLVGIIHLLNQLALPLCSLFVFFILKHFGVRNWRALLFSVLITFLSPQLLRYGGHFGLAYPFLLPMAMLWVLRKWHLPKAEKRDFALFAVLLFFTFNNPYVGFCTAGFLLCCALVIALKDYQSKAHLRPAVLIGSVSLLVLLVPYLTFQLSDPVGDRIEQQWGFFHYRASFEGLFVPPRSLLSQAFGAIGVELPVARFSGRINLGLVGSLSVVVWLVVWLKNLRSKKIQEKMFPRGVKIFLAASVLMFIYAANYSLYGFAKEWLEEHLGPLLMFKASGRFAWPLYFAVTIASVVFLEKYFRKIKLPALAIGLTLAVVAVWTLEVAQYVFKKYEKLSHSNFFHPEREREISGILSENEIDPADFQAILTVPKVLAWNDNLISDLHWETQFYSLRLSAFTGLPLVNAELSRISLGQAVDIAQLYSHPLIERELPKKFPNRKNLLLLHGGSSPLLAEGEQYLLDISEPLYQSEKFSLFRLRLDDLEFDGGRNAVRDSFLLRKSMPRGTIHLPFDEGQAEQVFFGKGAATMPKGTTTIIDQPLPLEQDSQFVFSAWTRLDHQKYGTGQWGIRVTGPDGQLIFNEEHQPRSGYDIQDGWIRTEVRFTAPASSSLLVEFRGNRPLDIDEVLVYPAGTEVFIDDSEGEYFLFNGIKIRK